MCKFNEIAIGFVSKNSINLIDSIYLSLGEIFHIWILVECNSIAFFRKKRLYILLVKIVRRFDYIQSIGCYRSELHGPVTVIGNCISIFTNKILIYKKDKLHGLRVVYASALFFGEISKNLHRFMKIKVCHNKVFCF